MEALENRWYSRDEISTVTGIDKSANQFARDVKKKLTKEGYAYEWVNRKGVRILSRTIPPQMRLKEILVSRLGLNSQTDAEDFAQFIIALVREEDFASMPWPTKERVLAERCGHNIDDSTLRRWAGKLYATGNAERFKKRTIWHTYTDENGIKQQEKADEDAYKAYCAHRSAALEQIKQHDAQRGKPAKRSAYSRMVSQLYAEYGYYYWCPEIVLNALGDDIDEIIALVDEIVMSSD